MLTTASERLRLGQACEARGQPTDLRQALSCYHEGLVVLAGDPAHADPDVRRLEGLLWMNVGNAQRKLNTSESRREALAAYERAIAVLTPGAETADAAWRNSLGAAWLNRGVTRHEEGPRSVPDAIQSFETALRILSPLATEEALWPRLNQAAAWMNLGNAWLDLDGANRLPAARAAAEAARILVQPLEREHPVAAELGLKARRVWCDAAGQLLPLAADDREVEALAREASDVVDDGLELWRRWQKPEPLRAVAERIFRFGVRLGLHHQPHFLAEFMRENEAFAEARREELEAVIAVLGQKPVVGLDETRQARLRESWRELCALREEIAAADSLPG